MVQNDSWYIPSGTVVKDKIRLFSRLFTVILVLSNDPPSTSNSNHYIQNQSFVDAIKQVDVFVSAPICGT